MGLQVKALERRDKYHDLDGHFGITLVYIN